MITKLSGTKQRDAVVVIWKKRLPSRWCIVFLYGEE